MIPAGHPPSDHPRGNLPQTAGHLQRQDVQREPHAGDRAHAAG